MPFALALDPGRTLFQYRCENWSRQNGLPVSSVKAITQTVDGYMWLGTQQGLVRFDGIEFTSYPMARTPMFVSQNITTIARSQKGGLWFGLKEGAAGYFDGSTYSPIGAQWEEPNMQVYGVAELSDGSVWASWNFGIGRWRPDGGAVLPGEINIGTTSYHGVYEDPQGRIWAAAVDPGAVYYWQNGEKHVFPDTSFHDINVFAFAVDSAGRIWMGTQAGLRCYDAHFHPLEIPGLTVYSQVNALLIDRAGVLWIGTEGEGLLRFGGEQFSQINASQGLIDNYVTSLYEDIEGNLWVGTRGGLSEFSDIKFPLYGAHEHIPGEPLGVGSAGDNSIWVATSNGVVRLADGATKTFGIESGLPNAYVKRVRQMANGDLYVIDGNRGLSIIVDGKVVRRHVLKDWPTSMTEDSEGPIVSFGPEIYRVNREGVKPLTYKGAPPRMVWVLNVWPARDRSLWVATHRGVWRVKDGEYQHWSTENGLSSSVANWVFEDEDGTVWAGLASGIARFKRGEVRCVSAADGLFDNFIYAIVPDKAGSFWCDSSAGIFRVSRQALNDVADGKAKRVQCEAFDGQDAVRSNDKHAQEPTFATSTDGRIWFPTAGGVVAIDPVHIPKNTVPPPVYIQRISIDGHEMKGRRVAATEAGRGDLEFHYTALSYIAPEKIRFRYLLSGYDEHWTDANDRRSAFYTNLKPGRYTFRVQACNNDGVWNETGDQLELSLPPHFYQTRWFIAVGVLVSSALLGALYAWRVGALRRRQRKLQAMNELLDAKVQSRTAELAEANRQLVEEIAERKRMAQEAEKMNEQLVAASREAGMAEVATSVLHNVGNVLNSVNVSVSVISRHVREAKLEPLAKIGQLLAENAGQSGFLSADERGKKIPDYLDRLAQHLSEQHSAVVREIDSLRKNIQHIKDIIQMQQTYSRLQAICEPVRVEELLDDAIRLSGAGLEHRHLKLVREIPPGVSVLADKPKVLQILVNLLRNAIHACADLEKGKGVINLRVVQSGDRVQFQVSDNGVGIAPENLDRLFTQGFTTKKHGHGYGLHSSALAAKAMDGTLSAASGGAGKGATFTLDLPLGTQTAPESVAEPGGIVI